jgi:hypothetical protein
MKKRDSKRRWKARCRIGRDIHGIAIVEHELWHWFEFYSVDDRLDICRARRVPYVASIWEQYRNTPKLEATWGKVGDVSG